MELKVTHYETPQQITFNFDELKNELTERVHVYETMVYDDTQIQQAKADRADLNRLKKAINDERLRREREYMEPFNAFKAQINEIVKIIDKPVAVIDEQVKAYENKQKEEKRERIARIFNEDLREDLTTIPPEWLKLEQIWDDRWLNVTVSVGSAKKQIIDRITCIKNDIETLQNLPEFGFEAVEVYKDTLDINRALNEARRMSEIQKAKDAAEKALKEAEERAKAEAQEAEPEPEPIKAKAAEPKKWVRFEAELTNTAAMALRDFFINNNINFRAV